MYVFVFFLLVLLLENYGTCLSKIYLSEKRRTNTVSLKSKNTFRMLFEKHQIGSRKNHKCNNFN